MKRERRIKTIDYKQNKESKHIKLISVKQFDFLDFLLHSIKLDISFVQYLFKECEIPFIFAFSLLFIAVAVFVFAATVSLVPSVIFYYFQHSLLIRNITVLKIISKKQTTPLILLEDVAISKKKKRNHSNINLSPSYLY